MSLIRYDGHRRIRVPCLGSVKMTRTLPEGIPYEVTISRMWPTAAGTPAPPTGSHRSHRPVEKLNQQAVSIEKLANHRPAVRLMVTSSSR